MISTGKMILQAKVKPLSYWLVALALVAGTLFLSLARPAAAAPDVDGDLDTTFGGTGKVTTNFSTPAGGRGLAIHSNGKIVVVGGVQTVHNGETSSDFAVAQYNSNGTPDTTFDGDGEVTTNFGEYEYAYAAAIQTDGKLVVVGTYMDDLFEVPNFAVARYNTNGALDTSFDGDGKTNFGFTAGSNDEAFAVNIQANGKIVVAGYSDSSGTKDFALARLNADGTLDTGFSGDGLQTIDFGGEDVASALAFHSNGKIVAGGKSAVAGAQDFALAQYNSDGTPDYGFDTDGKVTTDISVGGNDSISGLALYPNGLIVAAGTIAFGSSTGGSFALARYTSAGALDITFDGDGRVTTNFGGPANGQAMVIRADGKIVAAGFVNTGATGNDFALARYRSTGALDTTFSDDGKVFTDFTDSTDESYALALQSDGKLVAAGRSGSLFAVARYQYVSTSTPTPTATSVPPTDTSVPPTSTTVSTPGGSTPTAGSTSVPTTCPVEFSDVPSGSTFYPFVRCLACRNILGGYADGTFKPGNNITRGQLSKIVSNAAGFSEAYSTQSFEDVPVGSTFHQYAERMYSRGVISGYTCGSAGEACVAPDNRPYFRTGANATRGQIAKIVANAAQLVGTPSGQSFEDVPVGHTFYLYVERISSVGSISGYPCGGESEPCVGPTNRPYFRPQSEATRGQLSKIVGNTFFPNCQTP